MKGEQTRINPYLTFDGNCREAMTFYHEVLGGTLDIQTFEKAPDMVPAGSEKNVMHALLLFGEAVLMASDAMPGMDVTKGNANFISIAATNVEEGKKMFKAISEGGEVLMPWEKTFWNAMFGMCRDKYGYSWMVNCNLG